LLQNKQIKEAGGDVARKREPKRDEAFEIWKQ